jgi:hypothetical protein
MPSLLAFAGCTINEPVEELVRQKRATDPFRAIGFAESPFALSPAGVLQLLALIGGQGPVPRELWPFCYRGEWHTPTARASADAVVTEISTLTEFRLGEVVLNANIVTGELGARLAAYPGMNAKAVRAWKNALGKCREDLRREAAASILVHHPAGSETLRSEREVVAGLRTTPAPRAAVEDAVGAVRDTFPGVPIGLSLHRFQYMSGARAIDWPPELNEEVRAVAARLALPIFDGAALVAAHGNGKALAADCRGWAPDFLPVVADALENFVRSLKAPADAA